MIDFRAGGRYTVGVKALLRVVLASSLAAPSSAEVAAAVPSVTVSSAPVSTEARPRVGFGLLRPGPQRRAAIGVSVGMAEGKPLEVLVWGGGGAIVGSIAGPLGAVVGAAAGSAFGLLFSMFVVPRFQPGMSKKDRD